MAFKRLGARSPESIAAISVQLYKPEPGSTESPGASYSVQVKYDDDTIEVMHGDLVPYLSQEQISGLMAFMDVMRAKAINEILPE